jgi:hypothetical protein
MIPASPHLPRSSIGAILAVIIYFRSDIRRLASLGSAALTARSAPDYRFAWYVILGLTPIGIVRLSSPRPDLEASAELVGGGGGGARGLERGDVDRQRVGKRDRPEPSLYLGAQVGLVNRTQVHVTTAHEPLWTVTCN